MTNEELISVIKLLITILDSTTLDTEHPGSFDREPKFNCPDCSCVDCYRVSCEYNKSELFNKLCKELPEVYKNEIGGR